jgi:predicted solute-binding protein
MARRSLDDGVKGLLADGLRENLARNMRDNLKTIADKRAYMGMTNEEVTGYLRALRFTLDREDMEAIDVFKQAWRSLPAAKEATA